MTTIVFAHSDDAEKNLTLRMIDYIIESPHYSGEGIPPVIDDNSNIYSTYNRTEPTFVLSVENGAEGSTNHGFMIHESAACGGWNSTGPLPGYTVRTMRDAEMVNYADQFGMVYFALVGTSFPFISKENSIINYFKYYRVDDGKLVDCETGMIVPDNETVWCIYTCVKMGKMPLYVVLLDTKHIRSYHMNSKIKFLETDASVTSIMSDSLKSDLFAPNLTGSVSGVGKYIRYVSGDVVSIEMFTRNESGFDANEFKSSLGGKFSDYLTINTNLPHIIDANGVVQFDTSQMTNGEMAFAIVSVECGDFFANQVLRQHRMQFEYVLVKMGE